MLGTITSLKLSHKKISNANKCGCFCTVAEKVVELGIDEAVYFTGFNLLRAKKFNLEILSCF